MRIGLFGRGRLGSAILAAAQRQPDLELAWTVDQGEAPSGPVDVAIDASVAEAVEAHLAWALETGTDLVIGATGWDAPGSGGPRGRAHRRAHRLQLLPHRGPHGPAGLGAGPLSRQLDPARDPYLFEHHHRLKADAPSGTAKTLAAAVLAGCPRKTEWTLDSAQPHQLNIGVVRAGSEFGLHTVGLDAPSETLELTHQARSREPFARGRPGRRPLAAGPQGPLHHGPPGRRPSQSPLRPRSESMTHLFSGLSVALATPFLPDSSLDLDGLPAPGPPRGGGGRRHPHRAGHHRRGAHPQRHRAGRPHRGLPRGGPGLRRWWWARAPTTPARPPPLTRRAQALGAARGPGGDALLQQAHAQGPGGPLSRPSPRPRRACPSSSTTCPAAPA